MTRAQEEHRVLLEKAQQTIAALSAEVASLKMTKAQTLSPAPPVLPPPHPHIASPARVEGGAPHASVGSPPPPVPAPESPTVAENLD